MVLNTPNYCKTKDEIPYMQIKIMRNVGFLTEIYGVLCDSMGKVKLWIPCKILGQFDSKTEHKSQKCLSCTKN